MAPQLLVVGSVNADLYVEIDRLPQRGETILGARAAVRPGGKGANQAAAAARLGMRTAFAGQVGDDAFAAVLREALRGAGVDLRALVVSAGASGQAMILLQSGGENSIVVVPGANERWTRLGSAARAALARSSAVLLQREIPDAVALDAARLATQRGIPVLMDAGGRDAPLSPALLRHLSLLSPNETELGRLTGRPTRTHLEVVAAAQRLLARGVGAVLVKLGARGCVLVEPDGALTVPAFPVRVLDTTGAGDCFTAAYAVGLLEGMQPAQRLKLACAAAALCVTRKGALPAMPSRGEVDRMLERAARTRR
jgi:ribokinase